MYVYLYIVRDIIACYHCSHIYISYKPNKPKLIAPVHVLNLILMHPYMATRRQSREIVCIDTFAIISIRLIIARLHVYTQ